MFSISESDPTHLTLIGEPASIPGEFPNTVAASAKHNLVCVGTTGALAGVSCGTFDAKTGLGAMDDLRPFEINQSTPPVGPTNTVSHVFFSEDQSVLYTTVKGDPTVNNTGFLSAFSVEKGKKAAVSRNDVRSSPAGTAVLFGSAVIPKTGNIFATDASLGGAIISVDDATLTASTASLGPVDGQVATCWVTISPVTRTAFVTDIGSSRLVEMSVEDASILGELDLSAAPSSGYTDLSAAGGYVYILAPGRADDGSVPLVLVIDVSGGMGQAELMQEFEIAELGAVSNSQGMAVFV